MDDADHLRWGCMKFVIFYFIKGLNYYTWLILFDLGIFGHPCFTYCFDLLGLL